jgi:bis(5'-nucleosyl)-tetraphosphatase (symmetrical)
MSTYAIGDLQGCAASFDALLDRLAFDPAVDRVWLVGDLVNRGPDSLGALRRVMALGASASVVLGNHDLHLLAVSAGVRKKSRGDTIDDILAAPDADALLDWLRRQPLAHRATLHDAEGRSFDALMVHAGVLPGWSADDTMRHAAELSHALAADDWRTTLATLFGNTPDHWNDALVGADRLRVIVNALTRLRYCSNDGRMDFDAKDAPGVADTPAGYRPWFDCAPRASHGTLVVFGHWSTLGVMLRDDVIGLDSGCVWGGALTAVRLEDRARFQVPCPAARRPG